MESENWKLNSRKLKRMSFQLSTLNFQILFFLFLVSGACTDKSSTHEHDVYTCPMHPTVVSDQPGTCPVCGMDLVKKARAGEEVEITEDLAKLIQSPNEKVVANIKTIKGEFKSQPISVVGQGIVTYDTRFIHTIPARIGGRLEKVYLKYAFQNVRKGQKIAEIYSPELLTAQRELLYLIENDSGNPGLIESAKNKLYLFGASKEMVDGIIKRKETVYSFSIYSPYDGYVIRENQAVPAITTSATSSSSAMGVGMGESGTGTSANAVRQSAESAELLRPGNYVSTGQTLFKIVSASALRIELDLPISQAGAVRMNDEAELDTGDGTKEKVTVDFVQPFFAAGEEFVKLRVYMRKEKDLRVGQLVKATIKLDHVEALWVPKESVVDLGLEKIVFVKERDVFRPKKIIAGIRTNGSIEIKQGLSSSDELAANAQFLIDSESFIKTK